jgi:erythronate-4-phosphate dehydrogenase
MKIIADENIIFVDEAFSGLGEVHLYSGRKITNEILRDADVLLIRSVTEVDANLLKGTNVKFVGTATIGIDHVDTAYLAENEIRFVDALGCNSDAVAEYIFTALLNISNEQDFNLKGKSIGVVGVGNIGSRIVRLAKVLGMKTLQNDPPLKRTTGEERFLELQDLMDADIITLHVPLNLQGVDRTYHLLDYPKINSLKHGAILINASRGPVIENSALDQLIGKKNFTVALDVWENEPEINKSLLQKIKFASPHIAGYSYEGKINGTVILYKALCGFLNKNTEWTPVIPNAENSLIHINGNSSPEKELFKAANHIYSIRSDDTNMRSMVNDANPGKYFDNLRKNYKLRREFINYTVDINPVNPDMTSVFKSFRFKTSVS